MKIQADEIQSEIDFATLTGKRTHRQTAQFLRRGEILRKRREERCARSIVVYDGPSEHETNRERVETILSRLSGRDLAIAEAIMAGETWREISSRLGISMRGIATSLKEMGEAHAN